MVTELLPATEYGRTEKVADIHKDESGVCLRHFLDCIFVLF